MNLCIGQDLFHLVAGSESGDFLHYRRLFLVEPTPDKGWPRADGCAKMAADSFQYLE